jgi:purine-binding chemotaxis protein CheW
MTLLTRLRSSAAESLALDVVTLQLGGEILAIRATVLREVLEPVAITRVPQAPEFVQGLINVRGAVVPLADLRVTFGMPRRPLGPDGRILVLDLPLAGRTSVVGILADSVHEVTRIDAGTLEDVPPVGTRWPPQFVEAIGKWGGGFVMLPDLPAIFSAFLAAQSGTLPAQISPPQAQTQWE